jgi:hypothetical protein
VSAHGRRRPNSALSRRRAAEPSPTGPAQLGWALLVIAAALIGGLAAATLVHASLTVAVIVSVVAGGIAVLAVFRSPARPPEFGAGESAQEDLGRYPAPPRRAAPTAQAPPTAPVPTAAPASAETDGRGRGGPSGANQTVVQLLPVGPPGNASSPDAPWWDSAQGAPPAPSAGAQRVPAPDLSTYLASTFIAQCPRCGAFRLDIRKARNDWDFRCEACEYIWTWQPGTPWPPVRVMPRGRKE